MTRAASEGLNQVSLRRLTVLPGQAVHEVNVPARETRLAGQIQCAARFVTRVNPPKCLECVIVKALHTNTEPVHPGGMVCRKVGAFRAAGITLQCDFYAFG